MSNEYTVSWHQADSEYVDYWEFQYKGVDSTDWHWVQRVEPVDDCSECFQAVVQVPENARLIRSRSVGDGSYSDWSQPRVVLPDVDLLVGLSLCVLTAFWLAKVRQRE